MLDEFGVGYSAGSKQEPSPRPVVKRVEELYVSDEYKVFILTAQPCSTSSERAHLAVKPFHLLDDVARDQMHAVAQSWTRDASDIWIDVLRDKLQFYDRKTGNSTYLLFGELAPDVQTKLRGGSADPFMKYAVSPSQTAHDIPISRPLTFKKGGP